jgi:hypothetical protein
MFKKIFTFLFLMLGMALFISNVSEAQQKGSYPMFTLSPVFGVQFPVGGLNDSYNTSWNGGLELGMRVNRETGFFLKGGYYNMPRKDDASVGPDAGYVEITAGPRYVFTSPKVKAQFFMEAGLGAYIWMAQEFTVPATTEVPEYVSPSTTAVLFGVNGGPGVFIPLGKVADFVIKLKVHYTFSGDPEGGERAWVAGLFGVDFKL